MAFFLCAAFHFFQRDRKPQFRIGLLAFSAMTQLNLTGPLQVFASLPGSEVRVI